MAYSVLSLENLAELKLRVGNSTDTTIATILGINYPVDEGYVVYHWRNTSTATPDDFEIVCPTPRIGLAGRWFRVDTAELPQANADWTATTGVSKILNKPTTLSGSGITDVYTKNESDNKFLSGFTESDPTVPNFVKNITTTDIDNWNESYSWGDHNVNGYLTENSISELTNKSGNISQWINNVNYITLSAVTWANIPDKPSLFSGVYANLSGKPTLFSGDYNDLANKPTIPTAQVNSDWSSVSGVSQILNKPIIPTNTNQLTNGAGFITGVTSGQITTALAYTPYNGGTNPNGYLTAANIAPTFNNSPSRTVGASPTPYQISATKNARVSYTVTLTTAVALLNLNSSASVALQICPTSGGTYTTINSAGLSRTLAVAIAVGVNDSQIVNIQGEVPAGYYVKLVSTVAGGGTAAFTSGQEVIYN